MPKHVPEKNPEDRYPVVIILVSKDVTTWINPAFFNNSFSDIPAQNNASDVKN